MAKKPEPEPKRTSDNDYEAMMLLDRLESLHEDMEELGIHTIEELEARIRALHQQLGEPTAEE